MSDSMTVPKAPSVEVQNFRKILVAHLIVTKTMTTLQFQGERVAFNKPLTAEDIEVIIASLRHELLQHFTGSVFPTVIPSASEESLNQIQL